MRLRRLAFWLFMFVAVDFGTPFVGGAFTFEADTSAEGIRFHRDRAEASSEPAVMPQPASVAPERVSRLASAPIARSRAAALCWVTALPRARVLSEAPSAPSDDH